MTAMMDIIESFTDVKSLSNDMQRYNTFRISHINSMDHSLNSILVTQVKLGEFNTLDFNRDFTFGITTSFKSATKTITIKDAATYQITLKDRWDGRDGSDWTPETKHITDDYIIVKSTIQECSNQPCTIDKFDYYSLANPKYFDLNRSHYDVQSNQYLIIVDLNKLGVMTDKQKKEFESFIDDADRKGNYCDFKTICYLINRNNNSVKVGLYSLDQEKVFNVTLTLFDEHFDLLSEYVKDILCDIKMCSSL